MVFCIGFFLGCTQRVDVRPAEQPQVTKIEASKGSDGDIAVINPTVNYLIDQALQKETYVYASTHPIFKDALMVQYQESSGSPESFKLVLDDGLFIQKLEVNSAHIFPCHGLSTSPVDKSHEVPRLSFQDYLDVVVPQDATVQHGLYEINADQPGSEHVPNIVEVIFEPKGQGFIPSMLRLSDTRISKSVCFDFLVRQ